MSSLTKRSLAPLFLVVFIDSFSYFLLIPIFLRLFLHGDYGLIAADTPLSTRNWWYGIAVTLAPLASLLCAPMIGNVSDRFGRKKTILYCLIGTLIGYVLPIIGIGRGSLTLILLGRFITGAATSSQPVAQAAIIDISSGKEKAFYLSLIAFAMTLAMVLGPLTGSYLSDHHIVPWFSAITPYWFGMGLATVNILLLAFYYQENKDQQKIYHPPKLNQAIKMLFSLLWRSSVSRLLITFFLLELAWSQYYQAIFLYLTESFYYSTGQIGLFTGYIGFWMSLGLTVIYRLAIRYISIEKILAISIILVAVGLSGCALIPGTTSQWIFIIPVSVFVGMAYPSLLALMSNRVSAEHQGWIMGIARTLMGLAWMATALLSGWLINIYQPLPLLFAMLVMVVGLVVLFVRR